MKTKFHAVEKTSLCRIESMMSNDTRPTERSREIVFIRFKIFNLSVKK